MGEALANGWLVIGGGEDPSDDERISEGVYDLAKVVFTAEGKLKLSISVPFRTVYHYKEPRAGMATLYPDREDGAQ